MKSFVAVALLVACVAAQTTFDRKSLLNRVNRWDLNTYNNVPEVRNMNNWYPYDTTTLFTLEELVRTPLFQQYYTLPLFRQHISHPLFQQYLTTPDFQKYWTVPEFQTFFKNPVLFYKYIFPVVFTTGTTTTTTDDIWRTNVFNKDIITPTTVWDILGMRNNWMNQKFNNVPSTFYTNQYNNVDMLKEQYYNVLNKMVKPVDVTEVDVKVVKPIVEKIVDPMTGEVKYVYGDNEIVGDKVVRDTVEKYITTPRRQISPRFIFNKFLNREIMNKMIYNTPVDTMINRDLVKDNLYNKVIYNTPVDTVVQRDLLKEELLKKMIFNTIPTINRDLVNEELIKKMIYNTPVDTMMNRDFVKDNLYNKFIYNTPVDTVVPRDLLKEELLKKFIINTPVDTMINRDLVKEELLKKFFTEAPIEKLVNDKYYYNIPVDTMDKDALKKFFFNLPVDTMVKDDLFKKFLINKLPMVKDDLFQKYLIHNIEVPTMTKEELIKKYINTPITKDDLITKDFFPTVLLGDRPMVPKTLEEKMVEQKIVKDELIKKMARENIIA